jgi:hypothetical protein
MPNSSKLPGQTKPEATKRAWESPELIEETISTATRNYFSAGIDNYERTAPHYGS